jgi:hypothetical protein
MHQATTTMSQPLQPRKTKSAGFMGWLGRQVGHVRKALHTDVTAPQKQVVYRNMQVEQRPHPEQPNVVLRRTTVDEVIVAPVAANQTEQRKPSE